MQIIEEKFQMINSNQGVDGQKKKNETQKSKQENSSGRKKLIKHLLSINANDDFE